ncbi:MAG: hypothetical protein KF753_22970 [Caldilineaceae bacterium]|nr:hypothetical protein [Caldilineaceae bacterium]
MQSILVMDSDGSLLPPSAPNDDGDSKNIGGTTKSSEEAIETWLSQFGFFYNPFRDTDAERDEHLSNYFVEHPNFDNLAQLENSLVFARTGDGKTVLRLRLQSLYREDLLRNHVFCFSYTIPQEVAENPPHDILGHLPHILTASVRHAFVLLAAHGNDLGILEDNPAFAGIFASYFDQYLGTTLWLDDLYEALETNSIDPIVKNVKPTFDDLDLPSGWLTVNTIWLHQWIDLLENVQERSSLAVDTTKRWQEWESLLQRAGFQALLLLIDGIDVNPSPKDLSSSQMPGERMRTMAVPFVEAIQGKWFGENTYVKLFLPMDTFNLLAGTLHRNDPIAIIQWSRDELRQLLAARLQAATGGAVTDLIQLVEEDVHPLFSEWLLAFANFSPRYLLHVLQQILHAHVTRIAEGKEIGKISRSTLANLPPRPLPYPPHD